MEQTVTHVIGDSRLPDHLQRELSEKGCRDALWLSLVFAQQLGWNDLSTDLTTLLVEIDERRQESDAADEIACVTETFGPEVGQRFADLQASGAHGD